MKILRKNDLYKDFSKNNQPFAYAILYNKVYLKGLECDICIDYHHGDTWISPAIFTSSDNSIETITINLRTCLTKLVHQLWSRSMSYFALYELKTLFDSKEEFEENADEAFQAFLEYQLAMMGTSIEKLFAPAEEHSSMHSVWE